MKKVEEIFGIEIDESLLFERALTHPSYTQENDFEYTECYERLEFLGDAVLKLAISDILYKKYPDAHEGEMSKIRSIAVSDSTLSIISKNLESVSACAFEAALGAYYLDGKLDLLMQKLKELFVPYIEEINQNMDKYNAKALLQEYTQSINKKTPVYKLIAEDGPAHNKVFTVEVWYNGEFIARACGKSKKEAEQKCAFEACKKLGVSECQK